MMVVNVGPIHPALAGEYDRLCGGGHVRNLGQLLYNVLGHTLHHVKSMFIEKAARRELILNDAPPRRAWKTGRWLRKWRHHIALESKRRTAKSALPCDRCQAPFPEHLIEVALSIPHIEDLRYHSPVSGYFAASCPRSQT